MFQKVFYLEVYFDYSDIVDFKELGDIQHFELIYQTH